MPQPTMKEIAQPVQQYALYYPYIHIRDVNWLKSTLLWFQQVRRIVPNGFPLNDIPEVKTFAETAGPAGLLLQVARLWEEPVWQAKARLQAQIEANLPAIAKKYTLHSTPEALRGSFEVHRQKLLDTDKTPSLPDFLLQNELAWQTRKGPDAYNWLAMHPKFGSAVMSTLALAVARNEGLGIVTSDPDIHSTLLGEREADVFNALLDLPRNPEPLSADDLADDLAQLVFTTQFDLSSLTAQDIKTLIEEKKDLGQFRARVTETVSDIPAGIGPVERIKRLEMKKKDILHEWDEYRSVLPKFAREALAETSVEEAVKKAAEHLPEIGEWGAAIAAGKISASVVAGAPGFALSILAGAGLKMWRQKDSPLRFLSRLDRTIEKSWKQRTASLLLPQWSKFVPA